MKRLKAFTTAICCWLKNLGHEMRPQAEKPKEGVFSAQGQVTLKTDNATETKTSAGCSIEALGWLQGSFVNPALINYPQKFDDLSSQVYLLVCSQSCTVVSVNFARDPLVELIAATPTHQTNYRASIDS